MKFTKQKKLKNTFSDTIILSTKVDNICGTRKLTNKINLEQLFECLIQDNNFSEFRVNYNSQTFLGLFIKFSGKSICGTLSIFKSGTINYVEVKTPRNFLNLDEWINYV